jgi:hypothetical protein
MWKKSPHSSRTRPLAARRSPSARAARAFGTGFDRQHPRRHPQVLPFDPYRRGRARRAGRAGGDRAASQRTSTAPRTQARARPGQRHGVHNRRHRRQHLERHGLRHQPEHLPDPAIGDHRAAERHHRRHERGGCRRSRCIRSVDGLVTRTRQQRSASMPTSWASNRCGMLSLFSNGGPTEVSSSEAKYCRRKEDGKKLQVNQ